LFLLSNLVCKSAKNSLLRSKVVVIVENEN
jgi:hypothetical protein